MKLIVMTFIYSRACKRVFQNTVSIFSLSGDMARSFFFVLSLQNPVCLALRAALRSDQPRFEDQRPHRFVMPTVDPVA